MGMAINFSRQVPVDHEQFKAMCEVAGSDEFELSIAACMQDHGVAYFGRLAMLEGSTAAGEAGAPPALVTALRYGSVDDAKRGTAAVRELMSPQLTQWFGEQHDSLLGTITKVLQL